MPVPNKARLRNTLKKLNRVAISQNPDPRVTAQEALDYLSMMAGIKPVMLLGRGYNEPTWIRGVLQIAADQKFEVIEGCFWDASADAGAGADLPDWYKEHTRQAFVEHRAWYICRARATAQEVAAICESTSLTISQEARLLNYPECCVQSHYERAADYQRVWLSLLRRKSGGNDEEAIAMLQNGDILEPETEEERNRLEAAMGAVPVPFTSINACDGCVNGGMSAPANIQSIESRKFAHQIDKGLVKALE